MQVIHTLIELCNAVGPVFSYRPLKRKLCLLATHQCSVQTSLGYELSKKVGLNIFSRPEEVKLFSNSQEKAKARGKFKKILIIL